jgi:hypothetical protein
MTTSVPHGCVIAAQLRQERPQRMPPVQLVAAAGQHQRPPRHAGCGPGSRAGHGRTDPPNSGPPPLPPAGPDPARPAGAAPQQQPEEPAGRQRARRLAGDRRTPLQTRRASSPRAPPSTCSSWSASSSPTSFNAAGRMPAPFLMRQRLSALTGDTGRSCATWSPRPVRSAGRVLCGHAAARWPPGGPGPSQPTARPPGLAGSSPIPILWWGRVTPGRRRAPSPRPRLPMTTAAA